MTTKVTSLEDFKKFCESRMKKDLHNTKVGEGYAIRDEYWGDTYMFYNKEGLNIELRREKGEKFDFNTFICGAQFSLRYSDRFSDRPIRLNNCDYNREGELTAGYVPEFYATVEEAYQKGLEMYDLLN